MKKIMQSKFMQLLIKRGFPAAACVVVFVTTYMLILPAITESSTAYCGLEEHTHGVECLMENRVPVCGLEESDSHHHTMECFAVLGDLICGQEETEGHVHADDCYTVEKRLICPLEETDTIEIPVPVTVSESDETLSENGETAETETIVEMQVIEGHHHTDECYEEVSVLTCTQLENEGHTHSINCYALTPAEPVCGIQEHTHVRMCFSDPSADVEAPDVWSRYAEGLTGNYGEDIARIAASQIGYQESTKNYIVNELDELKGYTRYGAWYGDCYADWNTLFASFCVQYANVKGMPVDKDVNNYLNTCAAMGIFQPAGAYVPKKGDLIFLRGDESAVPNRIAVAADVEVNGEGNALTITIVEGDYENTVASAVYSAADAHIVGYAAVPENPDKAVPETEAAEQAADEVLEEIEVIEEDITDAAEETGDVITEETENEVSEEAEAEEIENEVSEEAETEEIESEVSEEAETEEIESEASEEAETEEIESEASEEAEADDIESESSEEAEADDTENESSEETDDEEAEDETDESEETDDESESEDEETEEIVYTAGTKKVDGPDYHITVTYTEDAKIPEDAVLTARELVGEEYEEKCREAMACMGIEELYFARFFNVSFILDGEEIEPEAAVQVEITYDTAVDEPIGEAEIGNVIHFAEDGIEIIDMEIEQIEDGGTSFIFEQNSFSDVGTVIGGTRAAGDYWRHPQGSITGSPIKEGVSLFNIDASGTEAAALPGVTYTVYDLNGVPIHAAVTEDDFILNLGVLPDGTYTVRQTAVPNGYVVNPEIRSFTVVDGQAFIGLFFDYKEGYPGYVGEKTAEVVDFVKRTYRVDLAAASGEYTYDLQPINYELIIDQSNSMLFPSELTQVGSVRLYQTSVSNGVKRNENAMNQLVSNGTLDINKVYYMISDTTNTSTVWAVWHDGNGWCYQDASYYAKAQFHELYGDSAVNALEGGNWVAYARSGDRYDATYNGLKANGGGGLDVGNVAGTLGTLFGNGNTVPIYEGSTYNRLHDLQQAVIVFGAQLGTLSEDSSVDLVTFASEVLGCTTISKLNSTGLAELIQAVNAITTAGGTRQDFAMQHVIGTHGGSGTANHTKQHLRTDKKNIIILITDGAPNGNATPSSVQAVGKQVEARSDVDTLITVGLSMMNVDGGREMLKNIATVRDGRQYAYSADQAGSLATILVHNILINFGTKVKMISHGDIKDTISDSFYLINPANNEPLAPGTRLALNGTVDPNGPGFVQYDAEKKEWSVSWDSQVLPIPPTNQGDYNGYWHGIVYVKAKEDFIGGNAIKTNKKAEITIIDSNGARGVEPYDMTEPNVNVRLLTMDGFVGEETVFLGDEVTNIRSKLEALLEKTVIKKIVSGTGDVLNYKEGAAAENGCYSDTFTIPYAARALNDSDWTKLMAGNEVRIDYTYDAESNNGAVGYFSYTLIKNVVSGEPSDYKNHVTKVSGEYVETYTLTVEYTAYEIDEADQSGKVRPENVHNGPAGPGTEVRVSGTLDGVENGYGRITANEVHYVHVIDGSIELTKIIEPELVSSNEDQVFEFKIYTLTEKNGTPVENLYNTVTITVKKNETSAKVVVPNVPRGTYVIRETETDVYQVKQVAVNNGTSCVYDEDEEKALEFLIGTNQESKMAGKNVIQYNDPATLKTSLYAAEQRYVYSEPIADSESEGIGEITNEKIRYYSEVKVQKIWASGDHTKDEVLLMLYDKNNEPVLDEDGNARILRIGNTSTADDDSVENKTYWTGVFGNLPIPSRGYDIAKDGYQIREVSAVTSDETRGYIKGIVENSGKNEPEIIYVKTVSDPGEVIKIGGGQYTVKYGKTSDGTLTATNTPAYTLPETGSTGTKYIYLAGLMLLALTAAAGLLQFRKRTVKNNQ